MGHVTAGLPHLLCPVVVTVVSPRSRRFPAGSSALPSNISYFGSSQEEDDLDEEEPEEEEELRNGGGVHLHSGGGGGQAPAASSCHSTPRKGKPPTRQPLNGHGKERARLVPPSSSLARVLMPHVADRRMSSSPDRPETGAAPTPVNT